MYSNVFLLKQFIVVAIKSISRILLRSISLKLSIRYFLTEYFKTHTTRQAGAEKVYI